jgi:lactate dehydrogenase-like 2-hydroxyacid dehydrogenase
MGRIGKAVAARLKGIVDFAVQDHNHNRVPDVLELTWRGYLLKNL